MGLPRGGLRRRGTGWLRLVEQLADDDRERYDRDDDCDHDDDGTGANARAVRHEAR
jgi:hypothetical protein